MIKTANGTTVLEMDEWLATTTVAELLGCSTQHVRNLCDRGELTYKRHGLTGSRRLYLIQAQSLYAFVETMDTVEAKGTRSE